MSATTIEQAVGQAIATRVRGITGGVKNSKFLINPSVSARKNNYQNGISDEVSLDSEVNHVKTNAIPASFGPTDRILVIWENDTWMKDNGIFTKLEKASDVEFIYSIGKQLPVIIDADGIQEELIPDFELTSTESIDVRKEHETLQIFTRRKVRV